MVYPLLLLRLLHYQIGVPGPLRVPYNYYYLLYSSNEIMGGEMKGKIVGNLLKGYVITSWNKGQQQSEGRQGGGYVIYIQAGSVT